MFEVDCKRCEVVHRRASDCPFVKDRLYRSREEIIRRQLIEERGRMFPPFVFTSFSELKAIRP